MNPNPQSQRQPETRSSMRRLRLLALRLWQPLRVRSFQWEALWFATPIHCTILR